MGLCARLARMSLRNVRSFDQDRPGKGKAKVITLERERVIRRPVQAVWDFFSDFEAMPSWQPEFRELVQQTPGPVGVGTVFRYRRKVPFGEQQGTMEITEWDPPRRLGFSAEPGLSSREGPGPLPATTTRLTWWPTSMSSCKPCSASSPRSGDASSRGKET